MLRPTRHVVKSDSLRHAFIPYIDVISLDRENLGIMKRHLGSLRTVRRASLIPNGDDDGLVRAIEALGGPVAAESSTDPRT
jgi:hypothetical protein